MLKQLWVKDDVMKSTLVNSKAEIRVNSTAELRMLMSQERIDMKTVEKFGVTRKGTTKSNFSSP
jgi:hypothetical protein